MQYDNQNDKLLRIAAMAMQGILSSQRFDHGIDWEVAEGIAKESILCAKELIRLVQKDSIDNYGDEN